MTIAYFPGDSRYYADLRATRSGFTITATMRVYFTGVPAHGIWNNIGMPWSSTIAGNTTTGNWTYDFRSNSNYLVFSRSFTVSTPGSYSVSGWVDAHYGLGRATPGSITVVVPPNAPAAPSTPTVTRNSDTSQTVSWTRNATTAAPYSSQQVLRRAYSGGAWGAWSTVATINTNYTNSGSHSVNDSSSVANRQYQYAVKASNTASESQSGTSVSVFTSPAAPSSLSASKVSDTSVQLTWANAVTHAAYQTQLEYSSNGGSTWNTLITMASGTTTYLWSSAPSGSTVVFRARTIVNASGNVGHGLTSTGWRQSNSVPLASPPNAPSSLNPNGVAFNATSARTFSWLHNPSDSSGQTAYEVRYRIGTGAYTSTGKTTSSTSSRSFPANTFTNGNSYNWQVRTWGVNVDAGPWSASASFVASAPPTVNVTGPANPLPTSLATATWTYNDPDGTAQSMWEAELLQDGNVLEVRSGSGTATSVAFTTRLSDATTYQVRVRVRDGASMWSGWGQRTFATNFPVPNVPTITSEWNEVVGAFYFQVTNPAGGAAVDHNDLVRSLDDGQTWEVVTTIPVNGSGFDKTAPLGMDVLYRVQAWTTLPSFSESGDLILNSSYIIYPNLAPSVRGSGVWVEFARNWVSNPRAATGVGWWLEARSVLSRASSTLPQGGFRLSVTATETGGATSCIYATLASMPAGSYVLSYKRDMAGGNPIYADVSVVSGSTIATSTSTAAEVAVPFTLSESSNILIRIGMPGGAPIGSAVAFTDVYLGIPGPYFDGDSPNFSVDGDCLSEWVGSPHNSPSVLKIEEAAGWAPTTTSVLGVSHIAGKSAIRQRVLTSNPFAQTPPLAIPDGLYTAQASAHKPDQRPPGSVPWVRVQPPETDWYGSSAAGVDLLYGQLLMTSAHGKRFQIRISSNPGLGSPDVYWTDLGLFAGDLPVDAVPFNDGETYRVPRRPDGGYWSVGQDWGDVLRMQVNQGNPPKIDLSTGLYEKALHWFDGRTSPVETVGESTLVTGSVEFVVTSLHDLRLARAMATQRAPHLLRLPDGTTVYASISHVRDTRLADGWYLVTFEITEVDR